MLTGSILQAGGFLDILPLVFQELESTEEPSTLASAARVCHAFKEQLDALWYHLYRLWPLVSIWPFEIPAAIPKQLVRNSWSVATPYVLVFYYPTGKPDNQAQHQRSFLGTIRLIRSPF
jgi:hypothetical protein